MAETSLNRKCPKCGAANQFEYRFCSCCGGSLYETPKARPAPPNTSIASNPSQSSSDCWRGFGQGCGFGCGCLALVLSVILFFAYLSLTPSQTGGSAGGNFSGASGITWGKYSRLYTGMSYRQAVSVLGSSGTESSRNQIGDLVTVAYTWQNADGSNIIAMFQNDGLVQKSQAGLE